MSSTTTSGRAFSMPAIASAALAAWPQACAPGMEARMPCTRSRSMGESSTRKTFIVAVCRQAVAAYVTGIPSFGVGKFLLRLLRAELVEERRVRAELAEARLAVRGEPVITLLDARTQHAAAHGVGQLRLGGRGVFGDDGATGHHAPDLEIRFALVQAAPRGMEERQGGDDGREKKKQGQADRQGLHRASLALHALDEPGVRTEVLVAVARAAREP